VATARRVHFDYDANYFRADGTGYDFDSVFARHFDAARFEPELAALEAAGLRGTVLDVGCAIGTFLHHAQRRGWTVSGVELADFARNEASRRLGVSIAPSLDALPAGAQYDVVTLHHVLEHIDDPAMFLERDVVPRVGRRLLVEVPNFGSLAAQAEGAAWKDLRPEQHVHHFEPDTLRRVLESAGLTVLDVRSLVDPLWNPHQVRRLFRSLRALRGSNPTTPQRDAVSEAAGAAALNAWRPPTGAMAFAITVSRIALAPVVHWIERTGRAERLVIEAQPARFGI
jgi:SAM-dependent methyltransferase